MYCTCLLGNQHTFLYSAVILVPSQGAGNQWCLPVGLLVVVVAKVYVHVHVTWLTCSLPRQVLSHQTVPY